MSDTIPVAQLRAFVERIERIEADIKDLNGDKSEVYKDLRGCGFDVKAVRAVVAKRKLDTADREERDAMFDLYWSALNGTEPRARAHAREIIEEFDAETGELTDNQDQIGGNGTDLPVEAATEKQAAGTSRPTNSNSPDDILPVEADTAGGVAHPAPPATLSDPYDPGPIPAFLDRRQPKAREWEDAAP